MIGRLLDGIGIGILVSSAPILSKITSKINFSNKRFWILCSISSNNQNNSNTYSNDIFNFYAIKLVRLS